MLEYNTHGLTAFYHIMKAIASKSITFCTTTLVTIALWIFSKSVAIKEYFKTKIREFFVSEDLSKQ